MGRRGNVDQLSGFGNRAALERDLAPLVEGEAGPFAVATVDVDRYRDYRDREGASSADAVLRTVARAIDSSTRQGDRAYRYADDVFAVILVGEAAEHAAEVARRMAMTFDSFAARDETALPPLRIGVARWPDDGRATDSLLRRAERTAAPGGPLGWEPEEDQGAALQLFDRLLAAAADLLAARDPQEIYDVTVDAAGALSGTPDVFVAVPGRRRLRGSRRLQQMAGTGRFAAGSLRIAAGDDPWGRAWETGHLLAASPHHAGDTAGRGEAMLGIPLLRPRRETRPIALLGLVVPGADALTQPVLDALTRLASLASIALARHETRLTRLSRRRPPA